MQAARDAAARLAAAGVDDPAREARLLLRWAAGLDGAALSAAMGEEMAAAEATRFSGGVERRAARIPMSHITGLREFRGRAFEAGPQALDPRPDTETLIDWALEAPAPARFLDLGTGTGCILLTLLAEWPQARGVGIDASPAALALAGRNAARLGVAERAELRRGDWLCGVEGPFDLVVSNPPYLAADEMEARQPELRHEPDLALDGGADGLDAYRVICAGLPRVLRPGAAALLEIGATQAQAVSALLCAAGLQRVETRADLNGHPRIVRAVKP